MATTLSREAFRAIAAVAWADGRMRKDEAVALVRAAKQSGLDGDDLHAVERATTEAVDIADVDVGSMSPWERLFTYALATWLAKLDGIVNAEELESLRTLAKQVDLPGPKLEAALSAVMDVFVLPEGNRPDKYDIDALEARMTDKLPALYRASEPPG